MLTVAVEFKKTVQAGKKVGQTAPRFAMFYYRTLSWVAEPETESPLFTSACSPLQTVMKSYLLPRLLWACLHNCTRTVIKWGALGRSYLSGLKLSEASSFATRNLWPQYSWIQLILFFFFGFLLYLDLREWFTRQREGGKVQTTCSLSVFQHCSFYK